MMKNMLRMRIAVICIMGVVQAMAQASPRQGSETPLRIMCVGDSITAGYTDNPKWTVPFEFGYRRGLYQRLIQAGYRFQFVGESPEPRDGLSGLHGNTPTLDLRAQDQDHHRGYGGWGTQKVLGGIGAWVAKDSPDLVLLMIGINDGGSVNARTNLEEIARTIFRVKPAVSLIIAQITPMAHFSQRIADYNQYIRDTLVPRLVAEGRKVTTVDQYRNLLKDGKIDATLFSNHINHPDAKAYDQMAQTWFEGITGLYPLEGTCILNGSSVSLNIAPNQVQAVTADGLRKSETDLSKEMIQKSNE
jgi:lysophospholipase L1-like esterase